MKTIKGAARTSQFRQPMALKQSWHLYFLKLRVLMTNMKANQLYSLINE